MNLIKDPWLPIIRLDGSREKIAICRLLDGYENNPVVEIEAPRPDFKNAIYQLLIGIVQVSAMPEDDEDWEKFFNKPYSSDEFSEMVLKYEECFEIDSDGVAFMQDFDLKEANENPVSALLIDAPGVETVKNNQAHFIKSNMINQIDAYWTAIALYTMQTFAPSGGRGYRTGLRGGGPLTTIILPKEESTLWEKIWLNVISEDKIPVLLGDNSLKADSDIFPWLKPSKISDKKGSELFCTEVHPFHHYFGMPRRVRLNFSYEKGICDLTGKESSTLVTSFITKNYGNSYDGPWTHPLNSYTNNEKSPEEFPLSIKAQPGGIGYRHWLGLAVNSEKSIPAKVLFFAQNEYGRTEILRKRGFKLWCAGFDMDNMKARCWYESTMPLYPLDAEKTEKVSVIVKGLVEGATEISKSIKSSVKSAWAKRPGDLKGDMSFLDTAFWQNTEADFYVILKDVVENIDDTQRKNELLEKWSIVLKREVEQLFNANALAQQEDGLDWKRVTLAREGLGKGIGKMVNKLKTYKGEV